MPQALLKAKANLLFLTGPNCCGKTSYYYRKFLQSSYFRVSFTEWIKEQNQTASQVESIHFCMEKLLSLLQQGKKVVLDDDEMFSTSSVRTIMIDKIKEYFQEKGGCEIQIKIIKPLGNWDQILCSHAFAKAEQLQPISSQSNVLENEEEEFMALLDPFQTSSTSAVYTLPNLNQIQTHYFSTTVTKEQTEIEYEYPNLQLEHFDFMEEVVLPLYMNREPWQLMHSILFVDSSCLCHESIFNLFSQWTQCYDLFSRIVIVFPFSTTEKQRKEVYELILKQEFKFPVYYSNCVVNSVKYTIALNMYLHSGNSQQSMYLCSSNLEQCYYIPHCTMDTIFQNETIEWKSILISFSLPSFLKRMNYIAEYKQSSYEMIPKYPFLEDWFTHEELITIDNVYQTSDTQMGVILKRNYLEECLAKNHFEKEVYLNQWAKQTSSNKETDEEMMDQLANRFLPHSIHSPPSIKSSNTSSSSSSAVEYKISKQDKVPKICMTIKEVLSHFGPVTFNRGRDYKNEQRISQVKTKIINDTCFKLYSHCQGSRDKPYKQESIFKLGIIYKAKCSCPIGEDGNCKHICAQILFYEHLWQRKNSVISQNGEKKTVLTLVPKPLEKLDPLEESWCVKVKIIKQFGIKDWNNDRGSGQVASIVAQDVLPEGHQKEIRLVMFNQAVELFYDKLQPNQVFYIAQAHVNFSNPKFNFSHTDNEYEIHLHEHSVVKPVNSIEEKQQQQSKDFKDHFTNQVEKKRKLEEEQNKEMIDFTDYVSSQQEVKPLEESPTKKRKVETKNTQVVVEEEQLYKDLEPMYQPSSRNSIATMDIDLNIIDEDEEEEEERVESTNPEKKQVDEMNMTPKKELIDTNETQIQPIHIPSFFETKKGISSSLEDLFFGKQETQQTTPLGKKKKRVSYEIIAEEDDDEVVEEVRSTKSIASSSTAPLPSISPSATTSSFTPVDVSKRRVSLKELLAKEVM